MILETQTQLNDFCAALSQGPYVAVDTEFLRDKTYFPRLCLLQMAGPTVEAAALDPFVEGLDWEPVRVLMANKNVIKVFHAARQDLEIFYGLYGSLPTPLYDTQVAAMVCGFGDQVAYNALVREILGVELEKSAQFTDWSRRPLAARQISYALNDVVYLRGVYEALSQRLAQKGREDWVYEEMGILNSPQTYQSDPQEAWRRIKIRSDKRDVLAVLRTLAAWREEEAIRKDVPRSRILKDETLADIALYKPRDQESLLQIRSLSPDLARGKVGGIILDRVNSVLMSPKETWPCPDRKEPIPKQAQATVELLKMLLRINSGEGDVAAKLIATGDDIDCLASSDRPDIPALQGWRYEVFGKEALALKEGRLALALKGGRINKIKLP